jgi:3-oxoacyl-[acyl-carrier-protein] synthase II
MTGNRTTHSDTATGRVDAVVVTGLGVTTPLGGDTASTWAALLDRRTVAAPIGEDWAAALPVRIAARAAVDPAGVLDRIEARRLDRCGQFALVALREAWSDAGFTGPAREGGPLDPDRVAVAFGSGFGGIDTLLGNDRMLRTLGARRVSPLLVPMCMPNGPAARIGLEIGARAAVHAPNSACATGAEAVAQGLDLIRAGRADVVVVGGAEAIIQPVVIAGFAAMHAMSRRNDDPAGASRPFDRGRDGFVMGEGAGVLVLESRAHALARGARIHGELAGAGVSSDAHHMVAADPEGRGLARALEKALSDAAMDPAEVVHVNAHATSTPLGDLAESRALAKVLGREGCCVSATKSMTGHLIGAAGAVEAVLTVLALRDRLAPPTANLDDPDQDIDIDIVKDGPRRLPPGPVSALSNAVGFGGHNVVLAFRSGS